LNRPPIDTSNNLVSILSEMLETGRHLRPRICAVILINRYPRGGAKGSSRIRLGFFIALQHLIAAY
jgi:hypothetical protein